MSNPKTILEQYRNGERAPVPGPLTYEEALALVTILGRLQAALKDLMAVPFGSDAATMRTKTKAHYVACAALADAEVLMGVTDASLALSGS